MRLEITIHSIFNSSGSITSHPHIHFTVTSGKLYSDGIVQIMGNEGKVCSDFLIDIPPY